MTQTTIALLVAQVVVQSKQPNSANIIISLENTKNYRRKDGGRRRMVALEQMHCHVLQCQKGKTAIIERVSQELVSLVVKRCASLCSKVDKPKRYSLKIIQNVSFEFFHFGIFTNFCPIKTEMSGNTV